MKLGFDPPSCEVVLSTGADFNQVLVYTVNDVVTNWPASTSVLLRFDDAAISDWSATVSTSTATFGVDKATADTVADGTKVRLLYVNGSDDYVLAIGTVARR